MTRTSLIVLTCIRDHAKLETEFNDDGDRDTISHDNDHSAKSKFVCAYIFVSAYDLSL